MATKLHELGEAIKLLVSRREERFAFEGPLRLFQFKGWLLDDRDVDSSFMKMRLLFLALALQRAEARALKKSSADRELLLPSVRITSFMDSPGMRKLVDEACGDKGILDIASIDWHPFSAKQTARDRNEIEVLNALTELRMRLHATAVSAPNKQTEASVRNGLALLAAQRRGDKNKRPVKEADSKVRRDAKRIRVKRRFRESFLFAAAHGHEWIMQFDRPRTAIFRQMRHDWLEVDRLKAFFATAKAYVEILDKDAAKSLSKYWSALEATPLHELPAFEPLPTTILAEAGIELGAKPRRSAEATSRAARQRPSG